MDSVQVHNGKIFMHNFAAVISENKEFLSRIDGEIGDGDHGINMDKGFSLAYEQLKDTEKNASEVFTELGNTLLNNIGGSMGPIYGSFFQECGSASREVEYIDASTLHNMLYNGRVAIQELGEAQVGDKTMIDVLVPAEKALATAISEKKSLKEAVQNMIKAAEEGMNSTKDLIAKKGRSARLGERSIGVLDAGAVSCYLLLQSLGNTLLSLS